MDAPKPPDKDSESYKKLKGALKRGADKHFEAPQAAPPSVKAAQQEDPSLSKATPPKPKEQPRIATTTPTPAGAAAASSKPEVVPPPTPVWKPQKVGKEKRYWLKSRPLRWAISLVLLGIIGYCGYYIYEFKLKGKDGQIWWPWEKRPEAVTVPQTTKTTSAAKPVTVEETAKAAEETKRKLEEQKRAQEAAAAAAAATAAAEQKRKQEAAAAQASLEKELLSVSALEAGVAEYTAHLRYEELMQQIEQLKTGFTTEKAKLRLLELQAKYQPLHSFKQTLIANVSAIPYSGPSLKNKSGGKLLGNPSKADAEKLDFTTQYGTAGAAWDSLPPDQIASLAAFYLKTREQQSPSKKIAEDYFNMMMFCLSQKLTSQATKYGTDAITIDRYWEPQVKQQLGKLMP